MTPAIAIILARAGSKGVPGKNIAPLAGRPCIGWSIAHALGSARVGLVAVSSDDPRALDIARAMGARAIERPAELAHDSARIDDAARHAAEALGVAPDDPRPLAILYANVPVRPARLTDAALALLEHARADSVQSYARAGKFHPWWIARLDGAGRVSPWEGDVLNHGVFRRQDLPPAFVPDGGVIALTARALFGHAGAAPGPHAFFGRERRGIESATVALPGEHSTVVDIDEPTDLLVAAAVLGARATSEGQAGTPSTP
ncbi:MAG: acylneuraminate cytidylyltransferase family protein [Phycisphaerales bacterium]|nr:acylneuraminate cytidylyltransferase family protein [Phycisphaerales bacterium]